MNAVGSVQNRLPLISGSKAKSEGEEQSWPLLTCPSFASAAVQSAHRANATISLRSGNASYFCEADQMLQYCYA